MSYSENKKSYGRKVVRRNRRKQLAAWCIVWTVLFVVGMMIGFGIMHVLFCNNTVKAETVVSEVVEPTEFVEIFEPIETPTSTPPIESEFVTKRTTGEQTSLGTYKLTAYCACSKCCGKSDGITASGVKAVQGVTVAADTSQLPFDTKILIDGLGEYTVQDTGGSIKGNRIDVYFESHQEALQFGVQYKEIFKGV